MDRKLTCFINHPLSTDEALSKDNSSVDNLLMGIATQDIVVDASGAEGKRKSPARNLPDAPNKRRNSFINKLDIL